MDGETGIHGRIVCATCGASYPMVNGVLDLRATSRDLGTRQTGSSTTDPSEWYRLNQQFLNYHRSLTPHTLLASGPIITYVGMRTGLREARNVRVLDVGGGTGHTLCSFFRWPETIDYYLFDPNLRLLHDQFVRLYPELLTLPMSHFLGMAEDLPFAEATFDLVLSLSSIDHLQDYRAFLEGAFRVLKAGGQILITSHLERPACGGDEAGSDPEPRHSRLSKLFSLNVFEVVGRRLFYRKHRVGRDDHTFHFESVRPLSDALRETGFEAVTSEEFKRHFWVVGRRPS